MSKIKITQIKSSINQKKSQKGTLEALGLRRINHSVEHKGTPEIMGMVEKISHLVKVEQV